MKRPKIEKKAKVRVCISMDEDVFLDSGQFIDNLSGFINKTIKNYIARQKELEKAKNTTDEIDSHNNLLCKNKKSYIAQNNNVANEPLNEDFKWW